MEEERRLDALSAVFMLAREMRRQIHHLMADEPWLAEAGFRPPCMGVLEVVSRLQPVSQRQISDHLGLDASDVVSVLDILESAGMVQRRRDAQDRRRHAVFVTEVGETAARHVAALRAQAAERALVNLDPAERDLLVDLLNRAIGADPVRPHVSRDRGSTGGGSGGGSAEGPSGGEDLRGVLGTRDG